MEIQLEQTDFINVIENNDNVLLDFYAEWCGPCQTLLPTIHKLADELKDDVIIKKVNVDEYPEVSSKIWNVEIYQHYFSLKTEKAADRHTGLITERNLRSKIDRLK